MKRKSFKTLVLLLSLALIVFTFLPQAQVMATGLKGNNGGAAPDLPGYVMFKVDSNELTNGEHGDGVLTVNTTFTGKDNEQKVVDWNSNIKVYKVYVKGGRGGNWYAYSEGSMGATGLVAPDNKGISHVAFYYKADGEVDPPEVDVLPLELVSLCTEDPVETRAWKVTNNNAVDVKFTYQLVGSDQSGEMTVQANSTAEITTNTVEGKNKLQISVAGVKVALETSKGVDCTPPVEEPKLDLTLINLTSLCSENPEENRKWRITNNNPIDVMVTYVVVGTEQTGTIKVKANSTKEFKTKTVAGANTVKILVDGVQASVKASGGAKCETPNPGEEEVITKINLVISGCLGLIEEANLIVKHKGKIKFGSTAELTKFLLENQEIKYEDIQAIEIKVAGKNKHFKLSKLEKDAIVILDGTLTINLDCDLPDYDGEELIKKIHLILKGCVDVEDIKLVLENGEKLDFETSETFLHFLLKGKVMKYKDIMGIELKVKGETKVFKLKDLKAGTIVIVDGKMTINFDCLLDGTLPDTDDDDVTNPPPTGTLLAKIQLVLNGCVGVIENVKLVMKDDSKIDFKTTNTLLTYMLENGQVKFEDIKAVELTANGNTKVYTLTELAVGSVVVTGNELMITLTCETTGGGGTTPPPETDNGGGTTPPPGTDNGGGTTPPPGTDNGGGTTPPPGDNDGGIIIDDGETPAGPGTGTDTGSNPGTDSGGVVIGDEETPRGSTPWYGQVLPQTGEGSPLGYYLGGLLLAGVGVAILRKRKISAE